MNTNNSSESSLIIEAQELFRAKVNWFVDDNRRWQLTVLLICRKAAESLREFLKIIENDIFWPRPFFNYQHLVNWELINPDSYSKPLLSEADLQNRSRLDQKLDHLVTDRFEIAYLQHLSESVCYWTGYNPIEIEMLINAMTGAYEHTTGVPIGDQPDLSFKPLKHLGIPPIFGLWSLSEIIVGGMFFRFLPLVIEPEKKLAYHPVQVGIVYSREAIENIDFVNFSDQEIDWLSFFGGIDHHITDLQSCMSATDMPSRTSDKATEPKPDLATVQIDEEQLRLFKQEFRADLMLDIKEIFRQFAAAGPTRESSIQPGAQFVFRREDKGWDIVFNGKIIDFEKDLAGLAYIHFLLKHPGQKINAPTIISGSFSKVPAKTFDEIEKSMQQAEKLGVKRQDYIRDSLENSEDADERVELKYDAWQKAERYLCDETSLRDLEKAHEFLQEKLHSCEDQESKDEILEKLSAIEEVLQKEKKNPARMTQKAENMRLTVFNAIKLVKNKSQKKFPEFASFLNRQITTGMFCMYVPSIDNPIKWDL